MSTPPTFLSERFVRKSSSLKNELLPVIEEESAELWNVFAQLSELDEIVLSPKPKSKNLRVKTDAANSVKKCIVLPNIYRKYENSNEEYLQRVAKTIKKRPTKQKKNIKKSKKRSSKSTTSTATFTSTNSSLVSISTAKPLHTSHANSGTQETSLSGKTSDQASNKASPLSPPPSPPSKVDNLKVQSPSVSQSKSSPRPKKRRRHQTNSGSPARTIQKKRKSNIAEAGTLRLKQTIPLELAKSRLQKSRESLLLTITREITDLSVSQIGQSTSKASKLKTRQEKLEKRVQCLVTVRADL
ncbi:hypothetical protein BKA69DRAFT_1084480 [Paraphysoderma sedebokerense]|nr:hypothetical protein BKA69DRAFT_1084480 [Paraphysoderma sedebokerense]